ncbi:MAG: hypothetical protein HYS56_01330, partial [Candidatus Omnitrophica bacterium]|nr:hypothetical protein [Candidatus Omnitrophota bacterium]
MMTRLSHHKGFKVISAMITFVFLTWQTVMATPIEIRSYRQNISQFNTQQWDAWKRQNVNAQNQALADELIMKLRAEAQARGVNGEIGIEVDQQGNILGVNVFGNNLPTNLIQNVLNSIPGGSLVHKAIRTEDGLFVNQQVVPGNGDLDGDGIKGEMLSAEYRWQFQSGDSSFDVTLTQKFQNTPAAGNQNLLTTQQTTVEAAQSGTDGKLVTVQLIKYEYDANGRQGLISVTTTENDGTTSTSYQVRDVAQVGEFVARLTAAQKTRLAAELGLGGNVAGLEDAIKGMVGYHAESGQIKGEFVITESPNAGGAELMTAAVRKVSYDSNGREGVITTFGANKDGEWSRQIAIRDIDQVANFISQLTDAQKAQLASELGVTVDQLVSGIQAKIGYYDGTGQLKGEFLLTQTPDLDAAGGEVVLKTAAIRQIQYDGNGREGLIATFGVNKDGEWSRQIAVRDTDQIASFMGQLTEVQKRMMAAELGVTADQLAEAIREKIGYNEGTGFLKGEFIITQTPNADGAGSSNVQTSAGIREIQYDVNGREGVIETVAFDKDGKRDFQISIRDSEQVAYYVNNLLSASQRAGLAAKLGVSEANLVSMIQSRVGYNLGTGQLKGEFIITQTPNADGAGANTTLTTAAIRQIQYDGSGREGLITTLAMDKDGQWSDGVEIRDTRLVANYINQLTASQRAGLAAKLGVSEADLVSAIQSRIGYH